MRYEISSKSRPKYLLKRGLEHVLPLIIVLVLQFTAIINTVLAESTVPHCLNSNNIKPLQGRTRLDDVVLKTTSQCLTFFSCLKCHPNIHKLQFTLQGLRFWSIIIALLRLYNMCKATPFVLDLSAVFDVIDDGIIWSYFEYSFGVTGSVLF